MSFPIEKFDQAHIIDANPEALKALNALGSHKIELGNSHFGAGSLRKQTFIRSLATKCGIIKDRSILACQNIETKLKEKYGPRAVAEALHRLKYSTSYRPGNANYLATLISYAKEASDSMKKNPALNMDQYIHPGCQSPNEIGFGIASLQVWLKDNGYPDLRALVKYVATPDEQRGFQTVLDIAKIKVDGVGKVGKEPPPLPEKAVQGLQSLLQRVIERADFDFSEAYSAENLDIEKLEKKLHEKNLPNLLYILSKSRSTALKEAFKEFLQDPQKPSIKVDAYAVESLLKRELTRYQTLTITGKNMVHLQDPDLRSFAISFLENASLLDGNGMKAVRENFNRKLQELGYPMSDLQPEIKAFFDTLSGFLETREGIKKLSPEKAVEVLEKELFYENLQKHLQEVSSTRYVEKRDLERVNLDSFLGDASRLDNYAESNVQKFFLGLQKYGFDSRDTLSEKYTYEYPENGETKKVSYLRQIVAEYRKNGFLSEEQKTNLVTILQYEQEAVRLELPELSVYHQARSIITPKGPLELRWSNHQSVDDTILAFETLLKQKGYPALEEVVKRKPIVGQLIYNFRSQRQLNTMEISQLQEAIDSLRTGPNATLSARQELMTCLSDCNRPEMRVSSEMQALELELKQKGYPPLEVLRKNHTINTLLSLYEREGILTYRQRNQLQAALDSIMSQSFTFDAYETRSQVTLKNLRPGDIIIQRTSSFFRKSSEDFDNESKRAQFFIGGKGDYRNHHVLIVKDVTPDGRIHTAEVTGGGISTYILRADSNEFLPQIVFRPRTGALASKIKQISAETVSRGLGRTYYASELATNAAVKRLPILSRLARKNFAQENLHGRSFFCSHYVSLVVKEAMESIGLSTREMFSRKPSEVTPRDMEGMLDEASANFQRLGELQVESESGTEVS